MRLQSIRCSSHMTGSAVSLQEFTKKMCWHVKMSQSFACSFVRGLGSARHTAARMSLVQKTEIQRSVPFAGVMAWLEECRV